MVQVSIILPVRNEENLILPAIERLRESNSLLPTEIIVVDGGSSDRTVELAEEYADQVIRSPKGCRSFQMHLGAQQSKGAILVFLHVDSRLPRHWQDILTRSLMESPKPPAALSFRIRFDSERFLFKLIAGLANFRCKFTKIPQGDQGLIVPRENYFSCGGFPDIPLMEEYLFLPQLRRLGKIEIVQEPTVTSARKYEAKGPIKNALKNSLLVLLFYLGVSPITLAEWY